jgi:hypothetical protein
MPENEFEKRVRTLMEDFNFSPSEAVWDKVEKQIPKQKSRRRWIILLFFCTGLMGSGYFIYNNFHSSSNKQIVTVENDKTQQNVNDRHKEPGNDTVSQENITPQISLHEEKVTPSAKQIPGRSLPANLSTVTNIKSSEESGKEQSSMEISNNTQINQTTAEGNLAKDSSVKSNDDKTKNTSRQKSGDNPFRQIPDSSHSSVTIKKQASKDSNKRWQIGVSAFYGRADVYENLFGINLGSNNNDKNSPANSTAGGGYTTDTLKGSGSVNAKGAFSLGIVVKKELTPKSSITFGVQYSKLQTEIETGTLKDSSARFAYNNLTEAPVTYVSNYYQPGTGSLHTNSYSLIQIPVMYEHTLVQNNTLNWDAGLSFSRLIANDAFVYDNYHQAYYSNTDLFRKTQITFLAGIDKQFKIGSSDINLGPQVQYGLTNLLKSNSYGSQHLFMYGIRANIFFKK